MATTNKEDVNKTDKTTKTAEEPPIMHTPDAEMPDVEEMEKRKGKLKEEILSDEDLKKAG